ncbi:Uncharacterized membrane protein YckC, RDD family [Pedococcus dokdonensis]|uniref:Uncharacterized membrane protein YckC, RDD family n=1 Tax=Pedococcus dokdonensis TaxID=443156 RepID=A0A1H0STZ4_9MICO|nr:RDD family protein [Pedococcus dokdonensis]SDP44726.1 Uncharacterized membrane protein YckC, RDD family [Pedococcus dokdonensis]
MTQAQASFTTHDQLGRGTWTPVAGWWTRVAARIIDELVQLVGMLPYIIGLVMLMDAQGLTAGDAVSPYGTVQPVRPVDQATLLISVGLMGLGGILSLVIWIWNRVVQTGRTGQSIGKAAMKIVLVSSTTGRPIGGGMAFVREIAHVLDGFFYIGYLWPLWDGRKQTFADKLVGTVVAKDVRQAQSDEPTWAQRALA